MTDEDVRNLVIEKASSSFQYIIICICFFITVIDGFDILSITFVAPIIAREWGLSEIELGIIFSSGLAGMGLGALFLSPLGDIYGRRTAILWFLTLISAGMFLTAFSENFLTITFFRLLTGLGIGGIASNCGTTILEFVGSTRRASALGFVFVGTPIGALISGSVTMFFVNNWGWEFVFISGGGLTLTMAVVVYFGLPESVEFLLSRRPKNVLSRLNEVLRKMKIDPLTQMPKAMEKQTLQKKRVLDVFHGELLAKTIPIGLIHLFYMFAFYAFVSWSSQLVVGMGLSDTAGITITMLINVGGIAGALSAGFLTQKLGLLKATSIGFVAVALGLICFGASPEVMWILGSITFTTGFFFFCIQVSLYTFVASCYPASVRATAIGLAFTIGRIGSVLGPFTVGFLLQFGLDRIGLLLVLAIPQIFAAILVARIARSDTQLQSI